MLTSQFSDELNFKLKHTMHRATSVLVTNVETVHIDGNLKSFRSEKLNFGGTLIQPIILK